MTIEIIEAMAVKKVKDAETDEEIAEASLDYYITSAVITCAHDMQEFITEPMDADQAEKWGNLLTVCLNDLNKDK